MNGLLNQLDCEPENDDSGSPFGAAQKSGTFSRM